MPSSRPGQSLDPRVDAVLKAARDAREQFVAWRRSRLGLRGWLLYALSVPLALAALVSLAKGDLAAAAASGAAFGLIAAGAHLNRRGILEELIAPQRRFTRSWNMPHKYLAASAVAAGTALAAYGAVGQGAAVSLAFGALSVAGFHLAYRLPRPVFAAPQRPGGDKVLRQALREAERRILAIEQAALRIGNRELEQRLQRIAAQGRAILGQVAERPAERFRARKFLNVYLDGAERVASRYAKTHRLARGQALEQSFRSVLSDIEAVFDRQLGQLAAHDAFDLDVQIEVLRKQLKREGII